MDDAPPMEVVDPEARRLIGMYDAPAFARRGLDVEHAVARLHARCRRERAAMLEMVHLRLRQWPSVATGPDDWAGAFAEPIERLWCLTDADPPIWSDRPATTRRRRAVALDLVSSLERFNRRWERFLAGLKLEAVNRLIDQYNRYYLLEKECTIGSARLAARFFESRERLSVEELQAEYPALPVPDLA